MRDFPTRIFSASFWGNLRSTGIPFAATGRLAWLMNELAGKMPFGPTDKMSVLRA
jgi:hypothetical protein